MALSNMTSTPTHGHIYFRYQSANISLVEWINLLTICLAPLITHIAFGYGNVILLTDRHPRLLERLTQFNPITIIWRYYSIVDRRIRARDWDRADMAASNVVFWDGQRWDGSEHLMLESRCWVTKLPPQSRVNWISSSTLATLAMTVQGVGAVAILARFRYAKWNGAPDGFPTIFNVLALLSFARLPAFLWLSDENGFEAVKCRTDTTNEKPPADLEWVCIDSNVSLDYHLQPIPSVDASEVAHSHNLESRLKPSTTFAARLWQVFGLIAALCPGVGLYLTTISLGPRPFTIITSLSSLCLSMYYAVLCASALLIFIYHILKGQAGNTALPCMNSTWYKWLNVLMILLAILMFVTNALETRILPNGKTSTYSVPPP